MNDRELLELAAKAANIKTAFWNDGREAHSSGEGFILPSNRLWNPLTDDGDALRLALRLRLDVTFVDNLVVVYWYDERTLMSGAFEEPINDAQDEREATRRAIVRAAAAIGKEM
ncbi:hypothetical protein [Achromobacter ruhlandii]|uniref:hypothetical protein n=1 Tax=Achromobacter ruhlandii TaxID=72557 RepID=UPI0009EDF3A4|nr:hypothetical protein [Achromobacter ruhlandii]